MRTGNAAEKAHLGWDRGEMGGGEDNYVGGEPSQSLLCLPLLIGGQHSVADWHGIETQEACEPMWLCHCLDV